MTLIDSFPFMRMRRAIRLLPAAELERIRGELVEIGLLVAT
jgi:hypothetical protein